MLFFAFVFVFEKKTFVFQKKNMALENAFLENLVVSGIMDCACYLMASRCNPMVLNLRIPSFLKAFLKGASAPPLSQVIPSFLKAFLKGASAPPP